MTSLLNVFVNLCPTQALGLPAMLYNYSVFRNTVESLIHNGDISFDEELRKHRSRVSE